ncbi:MAG: cysteine desulfurase [Nitrospinae bacterium]|nr:cysteine desulfurase [Nitrospinota bacterium]
MLKLEVDTGVLETRIRKDFPGLARAVNGHPLVYLDSAATAQKPVSVIRRMSDFDSKEYATVRRGSYTIGERATAMYEDVRVQVARLLNAGRVEEIIFTGGATHSINLVAGSWGRKFVGAGDEIIISAMEHHANIVPWQMLCEEKGARLRVIPMTDDGELVMEEFGKMLGPKTKLAAVAHVSNVLGTINPVKRMAEMAHAAGAKILVDGAQAAPHMKVDVSDIGCDFYVFSSHKIYGPTGAGVLYGKMETLETMPPFITGGDAIETVTFEKTTFLRPPARFEAGTPPISQVIGLGEAIKYITSVGLEWIEDHEAGLLEYGTSLIGSIPGLKIFGAARRKAGIISFAVENVHPHDVVTILDRRGIAVRGGHHCAQPVMARFKVPAMTRASLAMYNNREDLNALAGGLVEVIEVFS